jgi:beta-galactosidase/beta-glucuronidase
MHFEISTEKFVNCHLCLQFTQITFCYSLLCTMTVAGHLNSGFNKLACYLTPLHKDGGSSTGQFTGGLSSIY